MIFPDSIISHRIVEVPSRKLIGKKVLMSLSEDKTFALWSSFMPVRKYIQAPIGTDLYSVKVYDPSYFTGYFPDALFEKWAAVEVEGYACITDRFECLTLSGGLYAVFRYRGSSQAAGETYRFIYMDWLQNSGYVLDNRPHFEILGDKYKNNDPASEEDIYIPVNPK